jgi:inhibitor of cysteine peptidase
MEKFFSFIILLVAALLLAPGCIAEENVTVDESIIVDEPVVDEPVIEEVVTDEGAEANATEPVEITEETVVLPNYTADMEVVTLNVKLDETVLISLPENQTTGYMWEVTNSTGLEILNDTYVMDASEEGMVGVGGVHEWTVKAVETGEQTFTAVMMHVADEPTGEEETYTLMVVVEEPVVETTETPATLEKPVEEVVEEEVEEPVVEEIIK